VLFRSATGSIQFLVMGFVQGFSSGMAIITAQRYGAHNVRGIRESFAASIVAALITSIVLTITSLVFIDNLLDAMQMPAAIYGEAKLFIGIILDGTIMSIGFYLVYNYCMT